MGVIDPLDAKVATLQGRGKRITLRDASEKVLADFIIGKEIKGTDRKEGTAPALRPSPRPEADLRREHQGRASRRGSPTGSRPTCSRSRPARSAASSSTTTSSRRTATSEARSCKVVQGDKVDVDRKDSTGPWTMDGSVGRARSSTRNNCVP